MARREEPEFTEEQLAKCHELAQNSRKDAEEVERIIRRSLELLEYTRARARPSESMIEAVEQVKPGFTELTTKADAEIENAMQSGEHFLAIWQRASEHALRGERLYRDLSAPGVPREERLRLWRQLGEPDLDHPTINID